MKVEIQIDPSCTEPKVIVVTAAITEDVRRLADSLTAQTPFLSGSRDGHTELLEPSDLIRIYASGGKVFAVTGNGEYVLRLKLYELEARLSPHAFVRISNSEIVHLKKVCHFDLSLTGTICIRLVNGATTYVSRRYVSRVKKILGLK